MITFTYHATVVDDGGPVNKTVTPVGFECSLDGSVFEDCDPMNPQNQTKIYSSIPVGAHHFEVRSYVLDKDSNKGPDRTPAEFDWIVTSRYCYKCCN